MGSWSLCLWVSETGHAPAALLHSLLALVLGLGSSSHLGIPPPPSFPVQS